MKKSFLKLLCIILLLQSSIVYAVVSSEVLINTQDPTATGSLIKPSRVGDAGKFIADAQVAGLMATGLFHFNGTNWDRVRGDTTNGLWVNVKTLAGTVTPADGYANPTTALQVYSLLGGFNGTTWDRVRIEGTNADGDAVLTTGAIAAESYVKLFNGTTWDRAKSGIITGATLVDNTSNAATNIVTNTTTAVKATGGVLNRIIVNAAGTTSTVALYNIASAGCTGTPASGFVGTLATTTAFSALEYNHTFTLGICTVTAGAAAADISVLYR